MQFIRILEAVTILGRSVVGTAIRIFLHKLSFELSTFSDFRSAVNYWESVPYGGLLIRMRIISKPIPFIYLGSENRDPFIYLPFKINTYTDTSKVHRIAPRKE